MAPYKKSSEALDFTTFLNVVDGELSNTSTKACDNINPSTLKNNPEAPLSTLEDVDRAVKAAARATKSWAEVPWSERVNALENFADSIEAQAGDLVQMLMRETGKPVSVSRYFMISILLT